MVTDLVHRTRKCISFIYASVIVSQLNFITINNTGANSRGQHDGGYQALMGAPENITVTVTTASHYYERFSA